MMNLQGMLIAGGVAALVAGGVGLQVGKAIEKGACEKRIAVLEKAAATLIDKKDAEIERSRIEATFAKGEVARVNAQILRQFEEQKALLVADQAARDEAVKKADQNAAAAAREYRTTAAKFHAALEAIKNDPDECARAPLSADVKRMLDDILAGPTP